MGKRKEYRKIIKNYKEQKIVFQEEMKLDYSKLEETIAEAIKIEKERENENKRKHSKKRELLYKTLNIIFYMVLMIIVLSLLYSICMAFISGKIDDIVGFLITIATVYKGNIIKNLIMDCQSYTKYRPNETTGGIFVSWRRKEELPTGA